MNPEQRLAYTHGYPPHIKSMMNEVEEIEKEIRSNATNKDNLVDLYMKLSNLQESINIAWYNVQDELPPTGPNEYYTKMMLVLRAFCISARQEIAYDAREYASEKAEELRGKAEPI